ncbi:MAG: zinc ribbon domain-containing protein [Planctomycetota bacterium]
MRRPQAKVKRLRSGVGIRPNPLAGSPCPHCGTPMDRQDTFCPACGHQPRPAPAESAETIPVDIVPATIAEPPIDPRAAAERQSQQAFRCSKCGAAVSSDHSQRSVTCPFCDSPHVVEFAAEASGRQRPEYIVGFAITPEQAQQMFRQWLSEKGLFHPGDLARQAITDRIRGIYLPFWSFAMQTESEWTTQIGEYWYRTETYTTTDFQGKQVRATRTITETEWWPLSGKFHSYHSGYLVSGSRGLSQADAELIQPFQLSALRRFEPFYLAGWLCEEYSVPRAEAQQLCMAEFFRREQSGIQQFMPGDTNVGVQIRSTFERITSDLCLLPVYSFCYRYRGKVFRFLLNGQTGKMAGIKPYSTPRILVAITLIVLVFLLVLGLLMALSSASGTRG